MSKTLIKPVENGDFGEAQSSQCELRPTLAQPGWRWRNNPPLLVLDGRLAGKVSKSASSDLRGGGIISNFSDPNQRIVVT